MSVVKYLNNLEDLSGKEILVTGGTSGIGLSIIKHLLYKHAKVVVLARNLTKAEEVKKSLLAIYPNNPIAIIQYDQSDNQSVLSAIEVIIKQHPHFYALILNAGVYQTRRRLQYVDGYPQTFKTNFVGLAYFLDNLLPKLQEQHRFIIQGSLVAGFHLKHINSLKDKNISAWQLYLISKSGVESLFYHYSLSNNEKFTFYLVEPGLTSTDIIRDFPSPIRQMGKVFLKVVSHSNDKAALTALKALETTTPKNSFIVPRGLGTYLGYPKIKRFPKKRQRPDLYELLQKE